MSAAPHWRTESFYVSAFQEWLDSYRQELDLSLEALAERCDLAYSTLRGLLRTHRSEGFTEAQLRKLAEGLGVEWSDMQRQYIRLHLGWELEELSTESDDVLVVAVKSLQPHERRQMLALVREFRRTE